MAAPGGAIEMRVPVFCEQCEEVGDGVGLGVRSRGGAAMEKGEMGEGCGRDAVETVEGKDEVEDRKYTAARSAGDCLRVVDLLEIAEFGRERGRHGLQPGYLVEKSCVLLRIAVKPAIADRRDHLRHDALLRSGLFVVDPFLQDPELVPLRLEHVVGGLKA